MTQSGAARLWGLGAALWACVGAAHAVVGRHDVDPAAYLAPHASHGSMAQVGAAHGFVIAERWVMTAAHVADGVLPGGDAVVVAGRNHLVRRVVLHPTYLGGYGPGVAEADWIDAALIELEEPTSAVPLRLAQAEPSVGDIVIIVGSGMHGDGRTGPHARDQHLRTAENQLTYLDSRAVRFIFDEPLAGRPHEGISGPGDSGGPLLSGADPMTVVGISSRNSGVGEQECLYGTTEEYTRVDTLGAWVAAVIADQSPPWSTTPTGDAGLARAASEFFACGAAEEFELFEAAQTPSGQSHVMGERWAALFERLGAFEVTGYASPSASTLVAQVRGEQGRRLFVFELDRARESGLREVKAIRIPEPEPAPPDEPRKLRETLRAWRESPSDPVLIALLAGDCQAALDVDGEAVGALAAISELLWSCEPDALEWLRAAAFERGLALAETSDRAAWLLATGFLPPLRTATDSERLDLLLSFEDRCQRLSGTAGPAARTALAAAPIVARAEALRTFGPCGLNAEHVEALERELIVSADALDGAMGEEVALIVRKALAALRPGDRMPELAHWIGMAPDLKERVILMSFWSTWCVPCLAAVPEEREMLGRFADRGLSLVGVCGDETAEEALTTITRLNMSWPHTTGETTRSLVQAFAIEGWPAAAIVDRSGTVRHVWSNSKYSRGWSLREVSLTLEAMLPAASPRPGAGSEVDP